MKIPRQRRKARELALQVLFQQEFSPSIPFAEALKNFRGHFDAPPEVWDYAENLLQGVQTEKSSIDQLIETNSAHWSLARLALVELNILRIATYELVHLSQEIPPGTAINEAVEISKKYGAGESGSYVNGVLDQIRKLHSSEEEAKS